MKEGNNMQKPVSVTFKWVKSAVKALYPTPTAVGKENLPDEPCIIVGNHSQIHGPIVSEIFLEPSGYTWCVGKMMHKKEVPEYVYDDFWPKKAKGTEWFYRLLSRIIAPISEFIFSNANTIGVYNDTRILSTFRQTVRALNDGKNVTIFPEYHEPNNNILCCIRQNFVDVARIYYKKTGKSLSFVPMYIAPKLKKYYFARPIKYDPNNGIEQEKQRISAYVTEQITLIARSLPRHKVVPYENIPKREYPFNREDADKN